MNKFSYTAISKDGKTINGSAESSSKETLIETLHKQGLRPLVVKQDSSKSFKFGKGKVKNKDIVFYMNNQRHKLTF